MKTIGVVGASGQIGCELAQELARRPDVKCVAFCRNGVSAAFLKLQGLEPTIVDLAGRTAEALAKMTDVDVVVNCALETGDIGTATARNRALLVGLLAWLNAAPNRTLIHLSTISVYGMSLTYPNYSPAEQPFGGYGAYKKAGDDFLRRARIAHRNRLGIWRIGAAYGENQFATRDFVGMAVDQRIALPLEGAQPANLISIELMAACVCRFAEDSTLPGGVMSIHEEPNLTWAQTFDIVTDSIGVTKRRRLTKEESAAYQPAPPAGLVSLVGAMTRRAAGGMFADLSDWLRASTAARAMAKLPMSVETALRFRYDRGKARAGALDVGVRWIVPDYFYRGALPGPNIVNVAHLDAPVSWLVSHRDRLAEIAREMRAAPERSKVAVKP
jgi:nucleoside-diphosphate-sugar epimerase